MVTEVWIKNQMKSIILKKADRKCASSQRMEEAILRSDPQAEFMESLDLFELRSIQDLYCKEYKPNIFFQR